MPAAVAGGSRSGRGPRQPGPVGTPTWPAAPPPVATTAPSPVPAVVRQARPATAGPTACRPAAATGAFGSLTRTSWPPPTACRPLYTQGRTGTGVTVALYELEPFYAERHRTYDPCYGMTENPVSTVNVDGGPASGQQWGRRHSTSRT